MACNDVDPVALLCPLDRRNDVTDIRGHRDARRGLLNETLHLHRGIGP